MKRLVRMTGLLLCMMFLSCMMIKADAVCGSCCTAPIYAAIMPHAETHAYVMVKRIPSTCEKKGRELWRCGKCGKSYVKELRTAPHTDQYRYDTVRDGTIRLHFVCSVCKRNAVLKTFPMSAVGTYAGIFAIPEKQYYLPLYWGTGAVWQKITDAKNSGCLIEERRWNMPIIADHVNQGFGMIKSAVIGETRAVFSGETYVCVINEDGWNCIEYLETMRGVQTNDMDADLLTYTCNSDGTVRIVGWKRK